MPGLWEDLLKQINPNHSKTRGRRSFLKLCGGCMHDDQMGTEE